MEPDEGPHRLGHAQLLARAPGRGGENGEGVAQQVAGAHELVERVGVKPDQFQIASVLLRGPLDIAMGLMYRFSTDSRSAQAIKQ